MINIGGRPNEYKEEYIAKVDEYLNLCKDTERGNGKLNVNLPTVEGFAMYIDTSKKSLYNWEQENPRFLHALDKIRVEQQKRLLDRGLSGDYNPTIAKLILSSNHGMREKSDVTSDDKPIGETLIELIKHGTTNKD